MHSTAEVDGGRTPFGVAVERSGLPQKALAERLGVSASTFSRWVSGERRPTDEAYLTLSILSLAPLQQDHERWLRTHKSARKASLVAEGVSK